MPPAYTAMSVGVGLRGEALQATQLTTGLADAPARAHQTQHVALLHGEIRARLEDHVPSLDPEHGDTETPGEREALERLGHGLGGGHHDAAR